MAFAQTSDLALKPTLQGAGEEALASSMMRQNIQQSKTDILKNTTGSSSLPNSRGKSSHQSTNSSLMRKARQKVIAGREGSSIAGDIASRATEALAAGVNKFTSKLLQEMWKNSVESYGLSILLVNFHWLGNKVFGKKFFCDLGDEWFQSNKLPIKPGDKASGAESILGIPKKGAGLLEGGILVVVDAIILALILINVAFIVLLAWMIIHPGDALWALGFGEFWQLIKTAWSLKG